jgi:RNA polymerase sigma-70 factor (ECF subfamily)
MRRNCTVGTTGGPQIFGTDLAMDTRASLLMRIKDPRDSRAWTEFDAIYRPMLYRFAKSQGMPDADAEDEVQRCMAAIQQIMSDFTYDPRKGRFKGWLRTMINNRCRNGVRTRNSERARLQGRYEMEEQRQEETPEATFDRLWIEEHIKHGLRKLRQEVEEVKCRAFELYVIEERPVKEVCEQLGLTAAQLYKIKWQLTHKLREHLTSLLKGRRTCLTKDDLHRYHTGEVEAEDVAMIEGHLAACASCARKNTRLLAEHHKVCTLLRGMHVPPNEARRPARPISE